MCPVKGFISQGKNGHAKALKSSGGQSFTSAAGKFPPGGRMELGKNPEVVHLD